MTKKALVAMLLVLGCSSDPENSEGSTSSGGEAGTNASAGGAGGSGGIAPGSGGVMLGGASAGGGAGNATSGGGGALAGGGGAGVGGSGAGASGSSGAAGTGAGGETTWTPGDYASRKWARWPIPTPPAMSLPHPMSYTDNGETVTDDVTGLVWQKTTNSATTDWQSALAYCTALGAGWSLPTRIELTTILDTVKSGSKVNSPFTFGNRAGWTWASTPWVVNERKNLTGSAALSWFINFAVGDSNNSLSQTATSAYSRCVQVPDSQTLPAEHYAVSGGEVTDNYTGLVWQQDHSGPDADHSWDEAVGYCVTLTLGGQSWRLPSLNEIASIVDDVPSGDVSPAVDHAIFPTTSPDLQYWSANPYGTSTAEHWTLNFMDGFTAHRQNSTLGIVRCVR
jgi:hypothetical protein